jgi:hypothetical protein
MTDHFVEVPKKVLSPAAEAIFFAADGMQPRQYRGRALGAALRASADQVVPEKANAVGDEHDAARHDQWLRIRYKLLAIATELENQP